MKRSEYQRTWDGGKRRRGPRSQADEKGLVSVRSHSSSHAPVALGLLLVDVLALCFPSRSARLSTPKCCPSLLRRVDVCR